MGISCVHGSLGLFMKVSELKNPEMKINDGSGFSHLKEAIVRVEKRGAVWSPCGPDASVPTVDKVLPLCWMLANSVCDV